ncbi:hypothetical protein ACFY19_19910 [Streptosporangium saharense]
MRKEKAMGDHAGKPQEREEEFEPPKITKEMSDTRPDGGKHAKPSSK